MTDPTPMPPRRPLSTEDMIRKTVEDAAAWDRAGPPQKPALPREARGVIDPHPPGNIVRGGTIGTGFDHKDLGAFDHLEDLGRMSAEAVMKQCEATVASVEEMGKTVQNLVKRLGESLIECDTDLKHVAEATHAIREKAKHTEAVIDHVNDLSKSIRAACADFQKKVAL